MEKASDGKKQKGFLAPATYLDLSKGFASSEEAEAALNAFWDDLYEIRVKHRIPDVHATCRIVVDGQGDLMTTMHAGSEMLAEAMTAWAFGRAQGDRQERISSLLGNVGITRKSKP
jgi:hypothetical protein